MLDGGAGIGIMSEEMAISMGVPIQRHPQRVTLALGADGVLIGTASNVDVVVCAGTVMEASVRVPLLYITDTPGPYQLLLGQAVLGPLGARACPTTQRLLYNPFLHLPGDFRNLTWMVPLATRAEAQASAGAAGGAQRLPVQQHLEMPLACMVSGGSTTSCTDVSDSDSDCGDAVSDDWQHLYSAVQQAFDSMTAEARAEYLASVVLNNVDGRCRRPISRLTASGPGPYQPHMGREPDATSCVGLELELTGLLWQTSDVPACAAALAASQRVPLAAQLEQQFRLALELHVAESGPVVAGDLAPVLQHVLGNYNHARPGAQQRLVPQLAEAAVSRMVDLIYRPSGSAALLQTALACAEMQLAHALRTERLPGFWEKPRCVNWQRFANLGSDAQGRLLQAIARHFIQSTWPQKQRGKPVHELPQPKAPVLRASAQQLKGWHSLAVQTLDYSSTDCPMSSSDAFEAAVSGWASSCMLQLQEDGGSAQLLSDADAYDLPRALAGRSHVWLQAADLLLQEFQQHHAPVLSERIYPISLSFFSYYSFYLALPGVISLRPTGFHPNYTPGAPAYRQLRRGYPAYPGYQATCSYGQLFTDIFTSHLTSNLVRPPGNDYRAFRALAALVCGTQSVPPARRYCCGTDALQPQALDAPEAGKATA